MARSSDRAWTGKVGGYIAIVVATEKEKAQEQRVSELHRVSITTDSQGLTHVHVIGTDIELSGVVGCVVTMKDGCVPVAHIEVLEPDVEMKPRGKRSEP